MSSHPLHAAVLKAFHPTYVSDKFRFLIHTLRELMFIWDVFEQIGPLKGLLVYNLGAKYEGLSFVTRVYIQIRSWPVGGICHK